MLIYIFVFCIVEILAVFIDYMKGEKAKKILAFAIVIILSFLGGVRDLTIGTDVLVYGQSWFSAACNSSSIANYINSMNKIDEGYVLLNYFVSIFSNNINVFLFILQLICNGLVIATLYKYKDKGTFWFSTLIYICMYYCRTYNFLRQAIAVSLIFYGYKYLEKNKGFRFLLLAIIAAQFHFTEYIGIVIYLLYKILNSKLKNKKVLIVAIVLVTIFFVVFIEDAFSILYKMNVINYRIYNYINVFSKAEVDINIVETIFKLYFIIALLIFKKKEKTEDIMDSILMLYVVLDFIIYQLSSMIMYADRITFYFGYFIMLILPKKFIATNENRRIMTVVKLFSAIVLVVFWYYKFIYSRSCQVYPYTSTILNIL